MTGVGYGLVNGGSISVNKFGKTLVVTTVGVGRGVDPAGDDQTQKLSPVMVHLDRMETWALVEELLHHLKHWRE